MVPWNSMELEQQNLKFCPDTKFHGIQWNFFHTPEFHGIPWNSMELLIFPKKVPWNYMEFHGTFFWSSMGFYGIPWNSLNFIFKKIIFLNIVLVFDWWLDVIWLESHKNATYCIDFNIVICILNTPVSTKMAQGQRKWRAVIYIYIYIYLYIFIYIYTLNIYLLARWHWKKILHCFSWNK